MEQIRIAQEWDLSGIFKKPMPWRGPMAFQQASQTVWALSYAGAQLHSLNLHTEKARSYPFLDVNNFGGPYCDAAGHLYLFDQCENKICILDHQAKIVRAISLEHIRVHNIVPAADGFILIASAKANFLTVFRYASSGQILQNWEIPFVTSNPHLMIWPMFYDQTLYFLEYSHIINLIRFDQFGNETGRKEIIQVDERLLQTQAMIPPSGQIMAAYTALIHSLLIDPAAQTFRGSYYHPYRTSEIENKSRLLSISWNDEPVVFELPDIGVTEQTRVDAHSFLIFSFVMPKKKRLYRHSLFKWEFGPIAEQKLYLCDEPDLKKGTPLSELPR